MLLCLGQIVGNLIIEYPHAVVGQVVLTLFFYYAPLPLPVRNTYALLILVAV